MEERYFHGKKISPFSRKPKQQFTSIPTYPLDIFIFKKPHPRIKTPYEIQTHPVKIIPEKPIIPDDDITFTEQREGYVIMLLTTNKITARKLRYGISNINRSNSTSLDFTVSANDIAVIVQGSLDMLLTTTRHLHSINYISKEKHDDLSKKIEELINQDDSETESSASTSTSSEKESPRESEASESDYSPRTEREYNELLTPALK